MYFKAVIQEKMSVRLVTYKQVTFTKRRLAYVSLQICVRIRSICYTTTLSLTASGGTGRKEKCDGAHTWN